MNDMSAVIVPKSDQINADDLLAGPRTVTIARVTIKSGQDQPVSINIEGDGKVYRPCKSMARVLVSQWGPDASQYVGRSMTLYCDKSVLWGGMAVGGIRISHMSHIERDAVMALTEKKGSRKPFTVKVLRAPRQQQGPAKPVETIPTSEEEWSPETGEPISPAQEAPPEAERALADLIASLKRTNNPDNLSAMLAHKTTANKVNMIADFPHLVVQFASAREARQRDLAATA